MKATFSNQFIWNYIEMFLKLILDIGAQYL